MRAAARFLTHPVLCVLCGILLLFDWGTLANGLHDHAIAARYCPFNPGLRGSSRIRRLHFELARDPGFRAIFIDSSTRSSPGPSTAFTLAHAPARGSGFWGITARTERITFYGDDSLTPDERGQLLPTLVTALDSAPDGPTIDPIAYSLLKAGVTSRTRSIPAGYIHNAGAIALAVIFITGLPRTLFSITHRITHWPSDRREDRRLSRGLCPTCAYDLRADFESGCPECGWNRRDDQGSAP